MTEDSTTSVADLFRFDDLRNVAIPGVPGLEWRGRDDMKPGEVGFFIVYSPRTHKVTFTHLVCPIDGNQYEDGKVAEDMLWLGPLPPPPVYRAEESLD